MKALLFGKSLPILILLAFALVARADDDPDQVALSNAANSGDFDKVKQLVFQGVTIDNNTGSFGDTPLCAAASGGHLDILQFLLDKGANVDFTDHEGSTPLLHACDQDKADCAVALINAGANVNLGSNWHRTPLMYAAKKGDNTIISALIEHKVDLNANCDVGSAIYWAVVNDKLDTLKLLVDAGADLTVVPNGDTPQPSLIADAVKANDAMMIGYLTSKGVSPDTPNADGTTPLMTAAANDQYLIIGELIADGAKIDARDKNGRNALMIAAVGSQLDAIKTLHDKGADIDATDSSGQTALTLAGDRCNADSVALLTSLGAKRTDIHIIPKPVPTPPLSAAHAWALAVALPYTQRTGRNPHVLGASDPDDEKESLQRAWKITDHDSLIKMLDWLRDTGERGRFQTTGAYLANLSDDAFNTQLTAHGDISNRMKANRAAYIKWKDRTGLAWDLVRAANLVNMGYAAGYIQEDEAWTRLMEIAQMAQGKFSSWQELDDNFLDGREIWANKRDPDWDACGQLITNPSEPDSPWNQLDWKTDLTTTASN